MCEYSYQNRLRTQATSGRPITTTRHHGTSDAIGLRPPTLSFISGMLKLYLTRRLIHCAVVDDSANDVSQGVTPDQFVQEYLDFLKRLRTIYRTQSIFVFTPVRFLTTWHVFIVLSHCLASNNLSGDGPAPTATFGTTMTANTKK